MIASKHTRRAGGGIQGADAAAITAQTGDEAGRDTSYAFKSVCPGKRSGRDAIVVSDILANSQRCPTAVGVMVISLASDNQHHPVSSAHLPVWRLEDGKGFLQCVTRSMVGVTRCL